MVDGFKKDRDSPEPYDGAARFTEDILKTVDLKKYGIFSEHPYLIKEAKKVEESKKNEEVVET